MALVMAKPRLVRCAPGGYGRPAFSAGMGGAETDPRRASPRRSNI